MVMVKLQNCNQKKTQKQTGLFGAAKEIQNPKRQYNYKIVPNQEGQN